MEVPIGDHIDRSLRKLYNNNVYFSLFDTVLVDDIWYCIASENEKIKSVLAINMVVISYDLNLNMIKVHKFATSDEVSHKSIIEDNGTIILIYKCSLGKYLMMSRIVDNFAIDTTPIDLVENLNFEKRISEPNYWNDSITYYTLEGLTHNKDKSITIVGKNNSIQISYRYRKLEISYNPIK